MRPSLSSPWIQETFHSDMSKFSKPVERIIIVKVDQTRTLQPGTRVIKASTPYFDSKLGVCVDITVIDPMKITLSVGTSDDL